MAGLADCGRNRDVKRVHDVKYNYGENVKISKENIQMKKMLMIVVMALLCLMSAKRWNLILWVVREIMCRRPSGRSQKVTDALKITGTAEGRQVLNIVANRYFNLNDIYAGATVLKKLASALQGAENRRR